MTKPTAPAPEVTAEPLIETIRRAVNCSEITKSLAEEIVSYLQAKEVTAEPVANRQRFKDGVDRWEYSDGPSDEHGNDEVEVQDLYAHPPASEWNDAIEAAAQLAEEQDVGVGLRPDAIRALKREPR